MAIECRHCDGTGTCSKGENGESCDSCTEKAREGPFPFVKKKIVSKKGLPCGVCSGHGDTEGRAWYLQAIITPVLGLFVVIFVLAIIILIAMTNPTHHSEILTLLGTLSGSVVGFYFRGQHRSPKAPLARSAPKNKLPNSPTPKDVGTE
jgi:hypothetical protein